MKLCCEGLDRLLSKNGQKGISIIASNVRDRRRFIIQARSFDLGKNKCGYRELSGKIIKQMPDFVNNIGESISFADVMQVPIFFCPSCGYNLEKLIKRNQKEFDEVALEMQNLALHCQIGHKDRSAGK